MAKGKTASGFEYDLNPDKLKDARFLMEYAKIRSKGDDMGNILLMDWILGEDVYAALCKHCENEDGVALIEVVSAEFKEILETLTKDTETKN